MFILLHGVGFGPETMTTVADLVPGSHAVLRRAGASLAAQADGVLSFVGDGTPWVAAGVSGGATLALALALAGAPGLQRVVVHEPLVGRHAPSLWSAVSASRDALAAGALSAEQWFSGLIGGSEHRPTVPPDLLAEIEPFVGWDPPTLASPVPVRTTIGDRSGPARYEAATVLASFGAEIEVLDDCGHLAQLDNPKAFAEAVRKPPAFPGHAGRHDEAPAVRP